MHSFSPRICMSGFPFQLASLFVRPNREGLEKSLLRILIPEVSYCKALEDAGLETLFYRREELCSTLFKQIVESDGQQILASLLPARNDNERYNFGNRRMFSIPRVKTKRFRNSYVMHYADKQQL